MKMPPTDMPVAPRASQPWSRLLQASLAILAISAAGASAQTGSNAQKAHAQWRKEIDDFCKTRQVPYITADVGGAFEDQVLYLFRRMGMVE